jgi:UDP-N-acetylglucosamine--N-acetylmuramyl-(pentapeptide) pyrophosphoryl-undecaprenol N-acetylglucosamine transferase
MKIVLAAAGTAGHIEPALAVAEIWKIKYPTSEIIFLGTKTGLENTLIDQNSYQLVQIPKVPLPRKINLDLFLAPFRFVEALRSALLIVKGANLVIGFGGYVCAPTYLAAFLSRTPFIVHEANAIPGWANKLGAMLGGRITVARNISTRKFKSAEVVGIPLKDSIKTAFINSNTDWAKARSKAKEKLLLSRTKPTLLVMGGSQGSVAINKVIAESLVNLCRDFDVLHSVGADNPLPTIITGYYPVPYISDMASAYLSADLILARSGANTCAEVNALGKYAIFIPLNIGNGEQAKNADFLLKQERALVLPQNMFTKSWLEGNLGDLLNLASQVSAGNGIDLDATEKIVLVMQSHARIS